MFELDELDDGEDLTPEEWELRLLTTFYIPALNTHLEARKGYAEFIKNNGLQFFDKLRYKEKAWIPYPEVKAISILKGISITEARDLRDEFNEWIWAISDSDPERTQAKLVKKALLWPQN